VNTYYTGVIDEQGKFQGIAPLVFQKSILFGKYLTSMAYFNYGGLLTSNQKAFQMLFDEIMKLAKETGAGHIELRNRNELVSYENLRVKKSKVTMYLDLPRNEEILWNSFKSKLRSQIKRAQREHFEVRIGKDSELNSFYKVFSINMRDLGTPVYSKSFFRNVLTEFSKQAHIITLYKDAQPIASALLFGFNDTVEVPWASSLYTFNKLGANMLLYWEMLKYAIENGYTKFDFGRSTIDSGTHRFKEQWGAKPQQLYWYYWLRKGNQLPELNPDNPKYKLAISVWQKLPVWLTRLVGPYIVKNLP